MKINRNKMGNFAVLVSATLPSIVFGHGANFEIGAVNNQVVTTHYFFAPNNTPSENYDPYYAGQNARIAEVPMVNDTTSGVSGAMGHNGINNDGWYGQPDLAYLEAGNPTQGQPAETESQIVEGGTAFTGPGIAWGADGNGFTVPSSGSITVTESIAAPLQAWNGSSFSACTSNQLEGIRGSIGGLTATSLYSPLPAGYAPATNTESNSWSSNKTSINSDTHNQVEWRLDSISGTNGTEMPDANPSQGIYMATLTATITEYNSDGSVYDALTPSLPFYVLFEKGNSDGSFDSNFQAQVTAADVYVQNNLVPEPAFVGEMFLIGLIFPWRRRLV